MEIYQEKSFGLSDNEIEKLLRKSLENENLKKILIIPPDITRIHSQAGKITAFYYKILQEIGCEVDILPALGTHMAMTPKECQIMFGRKVPKDVFIQHNWRKDVISIGTIPQNFVHEISKGLLSESIEIKINKHLLDTSYDKILSIGQVVPHEVVGMANYTKNIVVGCGGGEIIHLSHILGALWGMENLIGQDHSPVRKVFDYAEKHFLQKLPLLYVLTVVESSNIYGLFIGRERHIFEKAVTLSQKQNIIKLPKPFRKIIVYLDEAKYKSTWLGNKAVYRTRMAIADKGELIIIAPGVKMFGEDDENDSLIRKYGYKKRKEVIELTQTKEDIQKNLAVAAHLIHGSSEGRFSITYAVKHLQQQEIEKVHYTFMSLDEALLKYPIDDFSEGVNTLASGEEVYYIQNPAKALWIFEQ